MADALAQATDVINRYSNRAAGTRAIDVNDPSTASTILDTFGRLFTTNGCSSVATPPLSLRQSLLLIGGDVIEGKVATSMVSCQPARPEPRADEIVENLYLRTLCRPPAPRSCRTGRTKLKQAASIREASRGSVLGPAQFAGVHL